MQAKRFISLLICISLLLSSIALLTSCEDEEYSRRKKNDTESSEEASDSKHKWPWQNDDTEIGISTEFLTEICTDPPISIDPIGTEYPDIGYETIGWDTDTDYTDYYEETTAKEEYTYIEQTPFVEAQMNFAVDLFKESVVQNDENKPILISPLSMMLALAMTTNGAAGRTLDDMEKTLGGLSIEDLNENLSSYIRSLPDGKKYRLLVANSIWMKDDGKLHVNEEFIDTVYSYYSAKPYLEPFDNTTVENINYWVSDNTDNMIEELIQEIDPFEVMYLINTICFDAEWSEIYEDYQIKDGYFTNALGEEKKVQMMSSVEGRYLEDENTVGFMKYYAGGYSFVALLPKDGADIYDYIDSLTPESIRNLVTGPEYYEVYAKIPQFSYEFDTDMRDVLTAMGMGSAFAGSYPDFSKMGTHDDGNLAISKVIHKTVIDVTQYGTRASGASAVVMAPECEVMPGTTKNVVLDRPFVYMIIDNNTRLPIFMGALTDVEGEVVGFNRYEVPVSRDYIRIDGCGDLQDRFSVMLEDKEGGIPYIRIDSVSELNQLTAILAADNMYFMLDNAEGSCSFNQLAEKYGDEFFEHNSLIIPYVTEGSGSIRHRVDACYIGEAADPTSLVIELCHISPYMGTDDMAGWFICVGLPKSQLDFGNLVIKSSSERIGEAW